MRRWPVLVPLVCAAVAVPVGTAHASVGCDSFNTGAADGVGPELGGNAFDQGEVVHFNVADAPSITIEIWRTGAPFDSVSGPSVLSYEIPSSGAYQFFGTEPDLGPFVLTCSPVPGPPSTLSDTGVASTATAGAAAVTLTAGLLLLLLAARRRAPR